MLSAMKLMTALGLAAALALVASGCASPDLNPPQPRADTGYVDFYASPPEPLSWEVARLDERTGVYKRVYSELHPPEAGILRLALPPGLHSLRLAFLDRLITHPVDLQVEVQDGKITPVRVTLARDAMATVRTKERTYGPTAYGRYGRRSQIETYQDVAHRILPEPEPALVYEVKERMPYAPRRIP